MVYTVGFGKRNKPGVSTGRTNTAQEAIELAEALTRSSTHRPMAASASTCCAFSPRKRPGRRSRHAGGEMAWSSFGFLIV